MILADTSVCIDHLIVEDSYLALLLDRGEILIHPMVIGELACGNVSNRSEVFSLLRSLPQDSVVVSVFYPSRPTTKCSSSSSITS